jgi:hypothetical protein
MGRAFALLDALGAWAFALAYLIAGATVSLLGTRGAIAVAAVGALAVTLYALVALRRSPDPALPSEPDDSSGLVGQLAAEPLRER